LWKRRVVDVHVNDYCTGHCHLGRKRINNPEAVKTGIHKMYVVCYIAIAKYLVCMSAFILEKVLIVREVLETLSRFDYNLVFVIKTYHLQTYSGHICTTNDRALHIIACDV